MKCFLVCFAFFFFTSLSAQDCINISANERIAQAQLKGMVETWCEEHFQDCFGWSFIDIQYISNDFSITPNGGITVKGRNRNSGFWGTEYTREFQATITCLSDSEAKIHFKKQQKFDYAPDTWEECTKTISF